jgi:gliding motility-associated-like protein
MRLRYSAAALILCLLAYYQPKAQCVTILNLPDTITVCHNSQVQLNPSLDTSTVDRTTDTTWTPSIGLSDPNIINPIASVANTSMLYTLTIEAVLAANSVLNGDFESGNVDFSSSYTYVAPAPNVLYPEGLYTITTNPHNVHDGFASFGDHTTGNGNMMVVNGASSPINVWCQTFAVQPNTNYDLSAWGANCSASGNPAQLQFEINNVLFGSPLQLPLTTGLWTEFFATWYSGANTSVDICIYDAQTAAGGNDFAIDDIKFQEHCTTKDSVYLKVVNMDPAVTNTVTTSCGSATAYFTTTNNGDVPTQYAWDFGDNGTSNLQNPQHTYTAQGTYNVRLVTTLNGCNDTTYTQVTINFPPGMNYSIADAPVNCLSTTFTATYQSGDNASQFLWIFDDNSTAATNPTTHVYTQSGAHPVTLVLTSPQGCKDTFTYTANLSVNIDYSISDSVIDCKTAKLSANFVSGDPATQFHWIFDDTITGSNTPVTQTFSQPGDHNAILIATSVPGCSDTFSHSFNLPVNIDYGITDSVIDCKSAQLTAIYNMGDTAAQYYWFFDNNSRDSSNPVIHTYQETGPNDATLVVENAAGCKDTFSHHFTINYTMNPDFTYYPLTPERDSATRFINLSPSNAVYFAWDFGDGTTDSIRNPIKLYNASGHYKVCLTASDTNNCPGIVCKWIDAIRTKLIDVPKAFSPNGDGMNDILYCHGVGVSSAVFKVYNRWGQVVFETDDLLIGWDGTYKNTPQPSDTYAYTVEAIYKDGSTESKQGNVVLLR